jgi:hypothetical protein
MNLDFLLYLASASKLVNLKICWCQIHHAPKFDNNPEQAPVNRQIANFQVALESEKYLRIFYNGVFLKLEPLSPPTRLCVPK